MSSESSRSFIDLNRIWKVPSSHGYGDIVFSHGILALQVRICVYSCRVWRDWLGEAYFVAQLHRKWSHDHCEWKDGIICHIIQFMESSTQHALSYDMLKSLLHSLAFLIAPRFFSSGITFFPCIRQQTLSIASNGNTSHPDPFSSRFWMSQLEQLWCKYDLSPWVFQQVPFDDIWRYWRSPMTTPKLESLGLFLGYV